MDIRLTCLNLVLTLFCLRLAVPYLDFFKKLLDVFKLLFFSLRQLEMRGNVIGSFLNNIKRFHSKFNTFSTMFIEFSISLLINLK